jgi:hypothetical protein
MLYGFILEIIQQKVGEPPGGCLADLARRTWSLGFQGFSDFLRASAGASESEKAGLVLVITLSIS